MKKVKIEIGKKLFLVIMGLSILLFMTALGYAVKTSNSKVMGHGLEEIDGLKEYVQALVSSMLAGVGEQSVCDLVYSSGRDITIKNGYLAISLPDSCFSPQGCQMIQDIFDKNGFVKRTSLIFSQDILSNKWVKMGSATLYVNGPTGVNAKTGVDIVSPSTPIFATSGTLMVLDDYSIKTNPLDMNSSRITVRDDSAVSGMDLYIC